MSSFKEPDNFDQVEIGRVFMNIIGNNINQEINTTNEGMKGNEFITMFSSASGGQYFEYEQN